MLNNWQHHIHKRKREQINQQQHQHPNSRLRMLDKVCAIFSVLMPMTSIPQIYKLYTLQDASSLSIWMWILYCVGVLPFLIYGVAHKVSHLILLNVLWLLVNVLMIVGIIIYS